MFYERMRNILCSNPVHTHTGIKLILQYSMSVLDGTPLVHCKGKKMSERDEGEMVLHVKRLVPNQESPNTRGKQADASPTQTPILNTFALLTRITNQEPTENRNSSDDWWE
jgi:hypothetical protein